MPLPSLILRLGVVVDPDFSEDSPFARAAKPLWEEPTLHVLARAGRFVKKIHEDDQKIKWKALRPDLVDSSWTWGWTLPMRSCFFLWDRWGWGCKGAEENAAVFSSDDPVCQFVTDDIPQVEELTAKLDASQPGSRVSYATLGIRLEDPAKEKDYSGDLCIGKIPLSPDPVRADRLKDFGKRAALHAVRHHSDVLLAIWNSATGDKPGGPSESMAVALEERIPVIVVFVEDGGPAKVRVLQTPEDLRTLQKEIASRSGDTGDPCWETDLQNVLGALLKFPDPPKPKEHPTSHEPAPCKSKRPEPPFDDGGRRIKFGGASEKETREEEQHHPEVHSHAHPTWYCPRAAFLEFVGDTKPRFIWTAWLWKGFEGVAKPFATPVTEWPMRIFRGLMVVLLPWLGLFIGLRRFKRGRFSMLKETDSGYQRHYGWVMARADNPGYGQVFGDAHRGGIIASYVLAAHAVLLALVGSILHASHATPHGAAADHPSAELHAAAEKSLPHTEASPTQAGGGVHVTSQGSSEVSHEAGGLEVASACIPEFDVHGKIVALRAWLADSDVQHGIVVFVAGSELLFIIFLLALSVVAKREDWHEAYVESRILSEALRAMEFLGPLGIHSPIPRLPHYLRGDSATPAPEQMWSIWYFRALVRMAPLRISHPGVRAPQDRPWSDAVAKVELLRVGPTLGRFCRKPFRKLLRKAPQTWRRGRHKLVLGGEDGNGSYIQNERRRLDHGWIRDQYFHHQKNTGKQQRIHSAIELFSKLLFVSVLVCASLHLWDVCHDPSHDFLRPWLSLLVCAGAPALIAAMHGFGSQIENARLRQRSSSMCKLLKGRWTAHEEVDLSQPDSVEANWGFAREALSTAATMMDETGSWAMLYKNTDIHAG